ncbi:MAG: multidrug ABC transporter ATP-binding protein [Alkaliphilus sp.]|nr:ABC transporter ATP-binding protein [bacterium AH-315-K05]MBN4074733.1 ABC transporter ATP-binding protein [bacterium AH-315-E09]PHS29156.1 MAG: multidrug ABC transporter ATP-binding protein [Alkaliphilus sp.]
MDNIVTIRQLQKNFGSTNALNSINLNLEKGKVYGLLGPNASGKTTLLKILAGLISNYSGEILIDGHKPSTKTKSIVAYLPDRSDLYSWMTVRETIEYYHDFFEDFDVQKARETMQFMDLTDNDVVEKLSKGMKARLKLALTLARDAKLYLLDEPFDGIDIKTREKLIETIINSQRDESCMLISTHHVNYVEYLLEDLVFLSKGHILLKKNVEQLKEENNKSIVEMYMEVFANA